MKLWLEHHELLQRSAAATSHPIRFLEECRPGLNIDRMDIRTACDFVKFLRPPCPS